MQPLKYHLDELLRTLQRMQRPITDLLNQGLTTAEIDDLCGNLPITLAEEAKELFSWRNGTAGVNRLTIDEVCLFPNYYFPSLECAVADYKTWLDAIDTAPNECLWDRNWFPIFREVGGCYFALDCSAEASNAGTVVDYMPDFEAERPFRSLSRMVVTLQECYRQGAYFTSPRGHLTMDARRVTSLCKALNPEMPVWVKRLSEMEMLGDE